MKGKVRKTSDWFLDILLKAQSDWDAKYSKNILGLEYQRQLSHYLNHLAKYACHQDFKMFMRQKTKEHKTKTDMMIISLCLLNQVKGNIPEGKESLVEKRYEGILEQIFWRKDEYDHTNDDEHLLQLYVGVRSLYEKLLHDFGLQMLDWIDSRRLYYENTKSKKRKKHESDESEF